MAGAGKCLLWLTALTTASLAVTGCHTSGGGAPTARAASTSTPAQHRSHPTRSVTPTPSHSPAVQETATPSPVAQVTTPPATPQRSVLVTSDGSDLVRVAGRAVRFPGPVTDAVISPNGTEIAFVDASGNIATAHLDGTGLRVLTAADPGVRRAQPTFEDGGSEIVFGERGHDGVWRLKEVAADGHDDLTAGKPDPTVEQTASDGGRDTAPSATWFQASHEDGARSVMVFEHRTPRGAAKVYVSDRNQRGSGATALLPGRAPAVSPSGDRVAFIGVRGQIEAQALPVPGRRPHPAQITWDAHPTGHLAWSPDGLRVLFSTRHDVESVRSTPARPGHNPVHVVLAHPGVASMATTAPPTVGSYAGTDPVTTAVAVSRARFVSGTEIPMDETGGFGISYATHVTLVSADDPSAAAPAAAMASGGPILFVRGGRLEPTVRDEIVRLLHRPRGLRMGVTVDIVGTPGAIPGSVASELRATGLRVRRFAPASAAADAAGVLRGDYVSYVVVSADDLPAIVSSAGSDSPVLLTDGSVMPSATAARLDAMPHDDLDAPATVYAVGGQAQAAVRSSWPGKRRFRIVDVGGPSPSAVSLAALQTLYDSPGHLSVTTIADWQDALIATMASPTLVVDRQAGPSTATRGWLAAGEAALRAVYVFGQPAGLADTVGQAVYGDRYVVRREPADIVQ